MRIAIPAPAARRLRCTSRVIEPLVALVVGVLVVQMPLAMAAYCSWRHHG